MKRWKEKKAYDKAMIATAAIMQVGVIAEGTKMTSDLLRYWWGDSKSISRKLICLAGGFALNDVIVDRHLLTPMYHVIKGVVGTWNLKKEEEDDTLDTPEDDELVAEKVEFNEEEEDG